MRRRNVRVAAAVMTLALVGAACTGDDDTSDGDGGGTAAPGDTGSPSETGGPSETQAPSDGGSVDQVQQADSVLDKVKAADVVKCGVRDDLAGFSSLEGEDHVGFDADFCRVVAAAVLGDATKVEFVDVETDDRFTALARGEIDVLIRNTTWTSSRDGGEKATFLHTTFYDGQGMMVKADSEYQKIEDLDNVTVCVAQGTTTEGNAAAEANRLGVTWEVRAFEDIDLVQQAFQAGQCEGWSSDVSQLRSAQSEYPDGPDSLRVFDEPFSKEPLGPAVRDGDSAWAQAVDWAIYATIQAEEFGITSKNLGEFQNTKDPSIQRFLGMKAPDDEGNTVVLDPGLGLPLDYATTVVEQVGNYAEIFDKNLSPLGIERGLNALWTDGGLQYAIPYR